MKLQKIKLPFKVKEPVLALGTQTKNRICFARGNSAYLSPIYPDLNNPDDFLKFKKAVEFFLKKRSRVIAYDLHPEYQSTKYALSIENSAKGDSYSFSAVGHHHAHIASCMAENGMKNKKVIGVAFDGTGLGDDGTLWGGEFLISDYRGYKRGAYLRPLPLIGGERAILEPWRLLAFWFYQAGGGKFFTLKRAFSRIIEEKKWPVLKKMYIAGVNSPITSSMGRLFDAAGSMILGKPQSRYEAQLAISLEEEAQEFLASRPKRGGQKTWRFRIQKQQKSFVIDPLPVFQGIARELKHRQSKGALAYRFHLSTAQMILDTCVLLRRQRKVNRVVLGGGVFQNKLLTELAGELLKRDHFVLLRHTSLSCNDSSISLGQAAIASGF